MHDRGSGGEHGYPEDNGCNYVNDFVWYESGQNAMWQVDGVWKIGNIDNLGSSVADIESSGTLLGNGVSFCPFTYLDSFLQGNQGPAKWMYKSERFNEETWTEAGSGEVKFEVLQQR